jgi:hypothetical protein
MRLRELTMIPLVVTKKNLKMTIMIMMSAGQAMT